jgi:hypothetical protein
MPARAQRLHRDRLAPQAPLPAGVLVLADQFLLLGVHPDHRVPGRLLLLGLLVDVAELRVAVRVLRALDRLGVALQGTLRSVGAGEEFREDTVAWQLYDMRTKAFGGDLLLSLDWSLVGPHGWRSHWIFYPNNLELALNRQDHRYRPG